MKNKGWLWVECLTLFGVGPFAFYYLVNTPAANFPIDLGGFEPRRLLFPLLWVLAIAAMLHWRGKYGRRIFERLDWKMIRRHVLPRLALSAVAMLALVWALEPARLFQLPLERPEIWMVVMVFYPLISVVPQEVVFRLFFFDRYASIFAGDRAMILASGFAFGHAHLAFNNVVAYVLSIIGGCLFAHSYARSRSLSLVWLEHSLYGQFIFTVGLGWYFYTGAAASHG